MGFKAWWGGEVGSGRDHVMAKRCTSLFWPWPAWVIIHNPAWRNSRLKEKAIRLQKLGSCTRWMLHTNRTKTASRH